MSKKLKSIRFRVTLTGEGVVNYDHAEQRFFLDKHCGGASVKNENQSFAKKQFFSLYDSVEEYESAVKKYAEANGKSFEEAKKNVPEYGYNLKISSNCIRKNIFGGTSDSDAVLWEFPAAAANYIADPLGYIRGYTCARNDRTTFKKKTCLNVTDAVDSHAVLYSEVFTKSGDRDDTSFFTKETAGKTNYVFEAFFDVSEAQFASLDDYFARRAIPADYYEGKNYIEKAFEKKYGRIPYTTGVFSKNNDIFGQSYGEYGLKMDDRFINDIIKVAASRLLSIRIDRTGGYAETAIVEYKPIYSSEDVIDSENGWLSVKNAEDLPTFDIYQFYEESSHQEWEERKTSKEILSGVRKANKAEKKSRGTSKKEPSSETVGDE